MNAPRKICVTGATGFVGSHLVPALIKDGHEVTCLVRDAKRELPAGARAVKGDLLTGEGVAEALKDRDALIHLAALLFGASWRDYLAQNATAARHLAKHAGELKKVVYVSSLAAAGPCAAKPGLPENATPRPVSAYGWSKLICEEIFKNAAKDLVILRPPIIYGSGDKGLLPLFRAARKGIATSPGFARDFPVSILHARDAVDAILAALHTETRGVYHLSDGEIHTMETFARAMGDALGRKDLRVFKTPLPIMAASAALCSLYGKTVAKIGAIAGFSPAPPRWNWDKYREAREAGWLADSAVARRELGFNPKVTLKEGMAETVAGYRSLGWI